MVKPAHSVPETIYVVYLPYLPLVERMGVGDWEAIPRGGLREDDCLDVRTMELAQGLADLYELPGQTPSPVGAFGRPRRGHVGDDPQDRQHLHDLQRAVVVAVLDMNESPLLTEDERDPNFGHYAMTSDNATVVAHGINHEGGYTGALTGSRVRRMDLGISVLEAPDNPDLPRTTIPPPADLRIPLRRTKLDVQYADATWESVRRGDDAARRLGRAIDWLHLAWLNTTALSDDLRIPALRAGFEVLLDTDSYLSLARCLSDLLRDDSAPVERTWHNLAGKVTSEELTDVAWWSVRFSFLRNALMHGGLPDADAWRHDGVLHTDLGEWYLRQAIKHTVANDGHDGIRDELLWRSSLRAAREWCRAQQSADPNAS